MTPCHFPFHQLSCSNSIKTNFQQCHAELLRKMSQFFVQLQWAYWLTYIQHVFCTTPSLLANIYPRDTCLVWSSLHQPVTCSKYFGVPAEAGLPSSNSKWCYSNTHNMHLSSITHLKTNSFLYHLVLWYSSQHQLWEIGSWHGQKRCRNNSIWKNNHSNQNLVNMLLTTRK